MGTTKNYYYYFIYSLAHTWTSIFMQSITPRIHTLHRWWWWWWNVNVSFNFVWWQQLIKIISSFNCILPLNRWGNEVMLLFVPRAYKFILWHFNFSALRTFIALKCNFHTFMCARTNWNILVNMEKVHNNNSNSATSHSQQFSHRPKIKPEKYLNKYYFLCECSVGQLLWKIFSEKNETIIKCDALFFVVNAQALFTASVIENVCVCECGCESK
jgi:hypothetical protein